jgi:hypothetical protein
MMTQAASMLGDKGGNRNKRNGNQAEHGKEKPQPDNTKAARKEATGDSPLKQANRHARQESAKDDACRRAVRNTTAIVIELQKDNMCQTIENKESIQWAARAEGDNVRRETNETTEHSLARITWICNKDKRAQREKLQNQLRTTMKEQYKQEIAGQETQGNKEKRTNKRNQKEIQGGKGGGEQGEKKAKKENEQDKAGGKKTGNNTHEAKGKPGQGNKFIIAKQTITKPERENITNEERTNRQTRKGTHSPTKTRNGTVRGTMLVFEGRLDRITGRSHTTHIVTEVTGTQTTQLREQQGKTWTAYEGNFIIRIGEGELIQLPEGDTIIFGKRNKQEEREEAKETIILVKTSAQAQIMVSDQEER